jgi:hypothetical protein
MTNIVKSVISVIQRTVSYCASDILRNMFVIPCLGPCYKNVCHLKPYYKICYPTLYNTTYKYENIECYITFTTVFLVHKFTDPLNVYFEVC